MDEDIEFVGWTDEDNYTWQDRGSAFEWWSDHGNPNPLLRPTFAVKIEYEEE